MYWFDNPLFGNIYINMQWHRVYVVRRYLVVQTDTIRVENAVWEMNITVEGLLN